MLLYTYASNAEGAAHSPLATIDYSMRLGSSFTGCAGIQHECSQAQDSVFHAFWKFVGRITQTDSLALGQLISYTNYL